MADGEVLKRWGVGHGWLLRGARTVYLKRNSQRLGCGKCGKTNALVPSVLHAAFVANWGVAGAHAAGNEIVWTASRARAGNAEPPVRAPCSVRRSSGAIRCTCPSRCRSAPVASVSPLAHVLSPLSTWFRVQPRSLFLIDGSPRRSAQCFARSMAPNDGRVITMHHS